MSNNHDDFKRSLKKLKEKEETEHNSDYIQKTAELLDKPPAPNKTQFYAELFKQLKKPSEKDSPEVPKP